MCNCSCKNGLSTQNAVVSPEAGRNSTDLKSLVAYLVKNCGEEYPAPPHEMLMRQALKLAEESGEVIKALCRYVGISRKSGSVQEVEDELADVVLSAYLLAHYLPGDIDAAIARKAGADYLRGWRELEGE